MPLSQALVGRRFPAPRPYEVAREKIREFAEALGDLNPIYLDGEAAVARGHRDVVAPPTFPIVVALAAAELVLADPEVGIDISHVVHSSQGFEYSRPVYAGDRLATVVTIDSVTSRAGISVVTTRADISTEDGEPVVTARMALATRDGVA